MEAIAEPRPHPLVGTQLVRSWLPEGEPRAEIVLVHGIGEHTGRYDRLGRMLAESGFSLVGADLIGWGGTGGRRGYVRDWADYLDQVQGLVERARGTGRPTVLFGQSMGGLIALEYTLCERPKPDLLVATAPSLKAGARWQRRLASVLGSILPVLPLPARIEGDQLSRDPAVGDAYFADPLVNRSATVGFGKLFFEAMDRTRSACSRLDVPTLILHGGQDSLVPSACTADLETMPLVERWFFPGLRHELFNEPEGREILGDVIGWITDRLARGQATSTTSAR